MTTSPKPTKDEAVESGERAVWRVRYHGSPDLKGYNIYAFKNHTATNGDFVANLGENGSAAEALCSAHNTALLSADDKAGGEVVSCCNHASDCAIHNAPALPVGPCDCGEEQLPIAWYVTEHSEILDLEWNTQRPKYEGDWKPLYGKPSINQGTRFTLTKEQADRIIAALDVTDGAWSQVADFVRSLQYTRPQPQADQPAERVAMTDEQAKQMLVDTLGMAALHGPVMRACFDAVRATEAAYGITAKDQS